MEPDNKPLAVPIHRPEIPWLPIYQEIISILPVSLIRKYAIVPVCVRNDDLILATFNAKNVSEIKLVLKLIGVNACFIFKENNCRNDIDEILHTLFAYYDIQYSSEELSLLL